MIDGYWLEMNMQRIPPRYRDVPADIRSVGYGLYLFGTVGTGKTYAAAGIMRAHIERGLRTRWLTVPLWLHEQRQTFNNDKEMESVGSLVASDLLVLDDIGVERATDWALEMLYVLISEAYNRGTPLVITSNLTLAALADKVGARIVSRIAECCTPVEMAGADRRLAARKERK